MGSSQQFSLRWNNYLRHITSAFDTLRTDEDLVDVTLSCEGRRIRAHKMLLSACSTYFRDLFKVMTILTGSLRMYNCIRIFSSDQYLSRCRKIRASILS